jgi:hypothetical protein
MTLIRERLRLVWAAIRGHAIVYGVTIEGTLYLPSGGCLVMGVVIRDSAVAIVVNA